MIPLDGAQLGEESLPQSGAMRVLPDDEADTRQRQNTRNLRIRVASLGVVAAVLVLIWALTGPGLPWIVWPLLSLGLIAGLDAWRVYATPPLTGLGAVRGGGPRSRGPRLSSGAADCATSPAPS